MSTYVIGDVHGCFDELKISYNPSKDSIIFTGDLVNRGNQSLEVLEFCMKKKSIDTVLGNHDVFLIKSLLGKKSPKRLKNICIHKNKGKFLQWLVNKPFLISTIVLSNSYNMLGEINPILGITNLMMRSLIELH